MSDNIPPAIDRRRILQAAGVGGAAFLAGCLGNEGEASGEPTEESTGGTTDDTESVDDGLSPAKETDVDRVAADPRELPDPIDRDEPKHHEIELETKEMTAEIEPGVTFDYMTFEGRIPGPMIRVREGDTVHLKFSVPEADNDKPHNIDSHAIYGPGGGAEHTTLNPGEGVAEIEFRAEYAGVHIYHCAVPNMDQHISAGMFGALLVEPKEGLPEVDHEFYFGQHELYTKGDPGEAGHHAFDFDSMIAEDPTYVLANGEAYAFTPEGPYDPPTVDRGDTVRVFLSNGGPNLITSWHAIGNNWTRYYRDGDLVSDPARNIETSPVSPGTVAAAEMETPTTGSIKLVDHALSRVVRKGRLAVIEVEGEQNTDIYNPDP